MDAPKMKTFNPRLWQRLEYKGIPIYLQPDTPLWLIPNSSGDQILQTVKRGATSVGNGDPLWAARAQQLIRQMEVPAPDPYPGRSALLQLERLEECWT